MIHDLGLLAPGDVATAYDVCVAGAGVAGITLAVDLSRRGFRVLLLEAGGLAFSEQSQRLYEGENVGRKYFRLDSARLRFLGGTSNHWAGRCRPLDAEDFEPHAHVPHSGWPIGKADLDPYLARTSEILETPADFSDEAVDPASRQFRPVAFHYSTPVLFGEKYFSELRSSPNVDLFLHANVVGVEASEARGRIGAVLCRSYRDEAEGATYRFRARHFVLAFGGIETPRMMLNFAEQTPGLFARNRDLIGRYFMEHPKVPIGFYLSTRDAWPYQKRTLVAPLPAVRSELAVGNAMLQLEKFVEPPDSAFARAKQRYVCAHDAVREFVQRFHDIWCGIHGYSGGDMYMFLEQAPNPDSRVTLGDDVDPFGLRRTRLDWRFTPLDHRTCQQVAFAFGKHLAANRLGNVKLHDWLLADEARIPDVDGQQGAYHHIGTTRMADDPRRGVVDRDCRVFGLDNLYIAGSSVFTTGGYANPTFTIVQLTLRLADHLAAALRA